MSLIVDYPSPSVIHTGPETLIKDVQGGIPKSDLLGVTVALIHVAGQRFLLQVSYGKKWLIPPGTSLRVIEEYYSLEWVNTKIRGRDTDYTV